MDMQIDIKALRASRDWTQADLAAFVGVDQATVSRWEKGMPISGAARKTLIRLSQEGQPKPSRKANREATI